MIERETQQLFHRLLLFERAGVIHHAISFGCVNESLFQYCNVDVKSMEVEKANYELRVHMRTQTDIIGVRCRLSSSPSFACNDFMWRIHSFKYAQQLLFSSQAVTLHKTRRANNTGNLTLCRLAENNISLNIIKALLNGAVLFSRVDCISTLSLEVSLPGKYNFTCLCVCVRRGVIWHQRIWFSSFSTDVFSLDIY